jgi:1-deoxyxylulose-5-phosphate synthase
MKYVNLGSTGLKVSAICLGCMSYGKGQMHSAWTLSEDDAMPFFQKAFDSGVNFFDTANAYSEGASEAILGKAVKAFGRRDEVVIATKFTAPTGQGVNERGASRKHIVAAVEASLRRLDVEYIDLYQVHSWDNTTPVEETLSALEDLTRSGKILHAGMSNLKAWQLAKALQIQALNGWTKLATVQVQYNLIYREEEREMFPLCADQGIGILAWSALARGFLAGNRTRAGSGTTKRAEGDKLAQAIYFRDEDFALQALLAEIAERNSLPPMQVALAWFASRPTPVLPIIGVTKMEQFEQALAALNVVLSDDDVSQLDAAYRTRPVFNMGG